MTCTSLTKISASVACAAGILSLLATSASADGSKISCPVSYAALKSALENATAQEHAQPGQSGLEFDMWGTVVNRDGIVCAVAFTGANRGSQWPGSRVISAQKANTANAFSLDGLALSTANLFSAVQPGGSLFGLQESNPVDVAAAYGGNSSNYGTGQDPLVGRKIGGVNVFGGGVALYDSRRRVVGAVGVSGDTSCADHNVAWRTRKFLRLDFVGAGVAGGVRPDNILFDITPNPNGGTGVSASGFGHPTCLNTADPNTLPPTPPPAVAQN